MSEFRVAALASGSSGNAVYAECADGALLVDAGLSGSAVEKAVSRIGGDMARVRAIVLTHDHADHVKGAGVLHRRYGVPLLLTPGTFAAARRALGKNVTPSLFAPGETLHAAGFAVHTLATPHDGAEPVAVVLERAGARCGILTDLGHSFPELVKLLPTLDAVLLESNYDPEMLRLGPYSAELQERIRSPRGHLSNGEAGELLRAYSGERLAVAMLAHLSENNNTPALALRTVRKLAAGCRVEIRVAPRRAPSEVIVVRRRAAAVPDGR